jgi:hypothetical protein
MATVVELFAASGLDPTQFPLGGLSEFPGFGIAASVLGIDMGDLVMSMPIASGLFNAINRAFPYLGRGCVVSLAAVSIITTELSVSTTWSAASSVVPSMEEVVNRAHKGSRLPLPHIERAGHKLPVGCESVVSPLTRSPLIHTARNCLS